MRGEKHHAEPAELTFEPEGVAPVDEGTRICGERSTTPSRRNSRLGLRAWCPSTKGQGFAGDEAPRRIGGRTVRAWGRGARRRRDKGLRGEKHHAGPEEETSVLPFWSARARPRAAVGWHQKMELLQQLRDIIILSDENRDSISENPSRIGLVREIHEGVLFGIVGDGSV